MKHAALVWTFLSKKRAAGVLSPVHTTKGENVQNANLREIRAQARHSRPARDALP